jgi:hypothetical protein
MEHSAVTRCSSAAIRLFKGSEAGSPGEAGQLAADGVTQGAPLIDHRHEAVYGAQALSGLLMLLWLLLQLLLLLLLSLLGGSHAPHAAARNRLGSDRTHPWTLVNASVKARGFTNSIMCDSW